VSLATSRLLVDERASDDGGFERTWLECIDGRLHLRFDDTTSAILDIGVLEAVMSRYGKPLADDVILDGPKLELAGGGTLAILRHRARYDVVAKDYLVYGAPGREPLAELCTSVTAALTFIARSSAGD
jgi:hypothetical protein